MRVTYSWPLRRIRARNLWVRVLLHVRIIVQDTSSTLCYATAALAVTAFLLAMVPRHV
jgi:hypothetical protein